MPGGSSPAGRLSGGTGPDVHEMEGATTNRWRNQSRVAQATRRTASSVAARFGTGWPTGGGSRGLATRSSPVRGPTVAGLPWAKNVREGGWSRRHRPRPAQFPSPRSRPGEAAHAGQSARAASGAGQIPRPELVGARLPGAHPAQWREWPAFPPEVEAASCETFVTRPTSRRPDPRPLRF